MTVKDFVLQKYRKQLRKFEKRLYALPQESSPAKRLKKRIARLKETMEFVRSA